MKALRVRRGKAQDEIDRLLDEGLYDGSRRVAREGEWVFLPVEEGTPGAVEKELPLRERTESLREKFGISSFDLVGDIAIVFVPRRLWDRRREVGEHLMEFHPRLKAVYARSGAIGGKFRLPNLELVAGEGSETTHRENGLEFRLDVCRAYFSPRQATERMELTEYVRPGDTVAVFFAGIGPIPVYISRFTEAGSIYALEMNPDACRYMRENLRLNRCHEVELMCGDVRELHRKLPPCDLVILPLPKGAGSFAPEAAAVLKPGGRAIFYIASGEGEFDLPCFKVTRVRRELQISPHEWRFVVHARRE